jgi:hypothetical protein
MAEVLNGVFSSVFMREDVDNIPTAEEIEMDEMTDSLLKRKSRRKLRN